MCVSYELKTKARELNRRFPPLLLDRDEMPGTVDMHPSNPVLTIRTGETGPVGGTARWGLVGSFLERLPCQPLLTLNGEGLVDKPFYSKILKRNRCLIPATAFHTRLLSAGGQQTIRISEVGGDLLLLAGIFDRHPLAGSTCAILTRAGDAVVGRMPIMIEPEEICFWLGQHAEFPEAEFEAILRRPPRRNMAFETMIEAEPSPQLSFPFA